jgi:translocation and assembly module TamA
VLFRSRVFPTADDLCVLGFLESTVEFDRRDDKLAPKSGFYLGLQGQAGVSRSTQLTPFVKAVPEARGYWSFGPERRFTLAGKLRAGTLVGFNGGETPIVTRFFSGGSAMRGFGQRRLSPQLVVQTGQGVLPTNELVKGAFACERDANGECVTGALGATVPVGGDGLFEASLELRFELSETWVLSLFVDNAMVSAEPLGFAENFFDHFYTAVGLGVRYRTPVGPLRFDAAYRLPFWGGPLIAFDPTKPRYVSQSGCVFTLGHTGSTTYSGAPDPTCTFHLSIGEAF